VGKTETLLQVREAEEKAKQTLEQADEKHRNILAAARREAVEKLQTAENASRTKAEAAIAKEKKNLAVQKDELQKKGNEEASKLSVKAKDRIPQAKTYIRQHFERTFDATTGTNE
jgi:V/A-type H+-transporting ATPase subunit G/H